MNPTQEQMMQAVVEAAGECWHELQANLVTCSCGEDCYYGPCSGLPNPSPNDLNELFRLARKLGVRLRITTNYDGAGSYLVDPESQQERVHTYDLTKGILHALYNAIKEK